MIQIYNMDRIHVVGTNFSAKEKKRKGETPFQQFWLQKERYFLHPQLVFL
jgi:hypothetical protein